MPTNSGAVIRASLLSLLIVSQSLESNGWASLLGAVKLRLDDTVTRAKLTIHWHLQ